MDLEVESKKNSPIKTIEKTVKTKVYFSINRLTSSLQLTTDQLFKLFKNNNNDIIENLVLKNKDIIEKDSNCRCFSMKSKKIHYSRKCKGCQIISRLIKTDYLETNKVEIFSGRHKNSFLRITTTPYQKSYYSIENFSLDFLKYVSKNLKGIENYETDLTFFNTNNNNYNYCINSILQNILLKKEKLYLYNNFLWCFICSNYMTIIKKESVYKNLGELCKSPYYSNYFSPYLDIKQERKLSKNVVFSIIKQLVYYLKRLEKYYFIHGEPILKYLSYSNEKIVIMGETHTLKIILEPSFFSSINYEKKRYFFNNERLVNFGIPFEKIEVSLNGSKNYLNHCNINNEYDELAVLFYKLGNKISNFVKMRNFYSIPICYKSFDFICFLISLINDKNFYKTFIECEKLVKIWELLWRKEDYKNLMDDITKTKLNSFEKILNVVKKYYIRFDAIEYFFNSLEDL
jgi:hypothetical protein